MNNNDLPFQKEYNELCALFNSVDFVNFMNHGYLPRDANLKGNDLLMPYSATLYKRLITKIDTQGLNILDVGCGRGGGVNVYRTYYNFNEVHGCDITQSNLDYCQSYIKNVVFKNCSSEKLDYADNSFDIVTNVESLHLYKNKDIFLKEVSRVLKPNGLFILTDCSHLDEKVKVSSNLKCISEIDITKNVADACFGAVSLFNQQPKSKLMDWLVNLYSEFANIYINSKNGYNLSYWKNNKL